MRTRALTGNCALSGHSFFQRIEQRPAPFSLSKLYIDGHCAGQQHHVLDEFWITDEKGHAYLRNIDVDFTSSPSALEQVSKPQLSIVAFVVLDNFEETLHLGHVTVIAVSCMRIAQQVKGRPKALRSRLPHARLQGMIKEPADFPLMSNLKSGSAPRSTARCSSSVPFSCTSLALCTERRLTCSVVAASSWETAQICAVSGAAFTLGSDKGWRYSCCHDPQHRWCRWPSG